MKHIFTSMALLIAKTNAISNKCTHNVCVWCGFWTGGIIGSYFFENEADQRLSF